MILSAGYKFVVKKEKLMARLLLLMNTHMSWATASPAVSRHI